MIHRTRRRQAGADRLRPAWWLRLPPLYGASVAHDGQEFLDNLHDIIIQVKYFKWCGRI